jgi:hypothetical protein
MALHRTIAAAVAVFAASAILAACGDAGTSPASTATAIIAAPSGTPDASATKVTPDELRARLAAGPALAPIFDAFEHGDARALLAFIDFKPWKCGGRGDDGCPAGVAAGTELPKTNTGPDTFYVSAETLQPYLELVLGGRPLVLDFFARSRTVPSRYILGFDGAVKGNGFPPLEDPATQLTGVLLTIDTSAPHSIQRVDLLAEFRRAASVGHDAANAPGSDYVIELFTQVN